VKNRKKGGESNEESNKRKKDQKRTLKLRIIRKKWQAKHAPRKYEKRSQFGINSS
jgi:hypothetical protein